MGRLKLLIILAVVGVVGWQGYLFYLKKSAPPGMYKLHGEFKPCSYFGDGRANVEGQKRAAEGLKRKATKEGDLEEVEFQMGEIEKFEAALRYCW